jgi:hypothetical protein
MPTMMARNETGNIDQYWRNRDCAVTVIGFMITRRSRHSPVRAFGKSTAVQTDNRDDPGNDAPNFRTNRPALTRESQKPQGHVCRQPSVCSEKSVLKWGSRNTFKFVRNCVRVSRRLLPFWLSDSLDNSCTTSAGSRTSGGATYGVWFRIFIQRERAVMVRADFRRIGDGGRRCAPPVSLGGICREFATPARVLPRELESSTGTPFYFALFGATASSSVVSLTPTVDWANSTARRFASRLGTLPFKTTTPPSFVSILSVASERDLSQYKRA